MRWPKTEDAPHCADGALDIGAVARFPPVATGQVDRLRCTASSTSTCASRAASSSMKSPCRSNRRMTWGLAPTAIAAFYRKGRGTSPVLRSKAWCCRVVDWTVARPDGSARLDVRITLRTDDDALVYTHYNGVLHAPAGVIGGGEPVDPVSIISAWCRSSKLPRRNTLG
jgi:hypothetical protein